VLQIAQQNRDPASIIVRYLAEQPFQPFFRRKPIGLPVCGWGERLSTYFWPNRECNWSNTCRVVNDLSTQVQRAIERLNACDRDPFGTDELMKVFKGICLWGRVKLPESNSSHLASEALRALRALAKGEEPPSTCRLNSAWTKLYAFSRPLRCVIYDSRVAAALTSILDPAMPLVRDGVGWPFYSGLGTIVGRGGSRPRELDWNWPNGYGVWTAQIAANRLCLAIVEELNRQSVHRSDSRKLDDTGPWTLREVEAVLFMEGY
jgi:hypothetical protein